MMKTFETQRLKLRPFVLEDAESTYREIYSDPEVVRYYSRRGVHSDVEQTRQYIAASLASWSDPPLGRWAVVRLADGHLIGQIHLTPWVCDVPELLGTEHATVEVELAFAFGRSWWSAGYATEACRALIDYAFNELRLGRLVADVHAGNERSLALHRRLGYDVHRDPDPEKPWLWAVLSSPA